MLVYGIFIIIKKYIIAEYDKGYYFALMFSSHEMHVFKNNLGFVRVFFIF